MLTVVKNNRQPSVPHHSGELGPSPNKKSPPVGVKAAPALSYLCYTKYVRPQRERISSVLVRSEVSACPAIWISNRVWFLFPSVVQNYPTIQPN